MITGVASRTLLALRRSYTKNNHHRDRIENLICSSLHYQAVIFGGMI